MRTIFIIIPSREFSVADECLLFLNTNLLHLVSMYMYILYYVLYFILGVSIAALTFFIIYFN